MKKTLLCIILFLISLGTIFSQEKSTTSIEKLTIRLGNLGTVPGSISEYFTAEELVLLKNHLNNNREDVEENFNSEMKSMMATNAYTTSASEFGSFEPPSGEVTVISNNSGIINAGVINPNNPNEAFVLDNTGDFYSIDVATGVYTSLGSIPGAWLGAEVNPVDGNIYALEADKNLYLIDAEAVSATLIGDTGIDLLIALAIDGLGNAYSYSISDDNLYAIDLNTGVATLIGAIGFDANFGQGMFWHTQTNTIYMAAFNNILFDAELRSVNTTTGETTFISTLGTAGGLEQFGWASSEVVAPEPNPQIYDTWYLTFLQSTDLNNPYTIEDVDPVIQPSITILDNLSFTGIGACNGFSGSFIFNEPYYLNANNDFTTTLLECNDLIHNLFENDYFDFLSNEFSFEIIEENNGITLILENPLGGLAIFNNAPGPDPQVYNTWYLSEMTVDLGESTYVADIFPPISPTMIVNPDLYFTGESACNAYMGDFMFHESGDFFTIHNFDTTLSLCDFDSHNDFDTQFYSYFGVNADVLYYVGGTGGEQYFILEFTPGYELIFQNTPVLSINENELASFKLYPNPTSDQLFISSEFLEIESVTIFSALGRKILEVDNVENAIDVSHLTEGLYFVEVSNQDGKSVKKFIKK